MKETALALLKIAVSLFSPLAELISSALDNHAPDTGAQASLADEVRAVLPVKSETAKALDELDAPEKTP